MLVLVVIVVVGCAASLWHAYHPEAAATERWARERELSLTPSSRAAVDTYLRRARLGRAWGAVAGVAVPTLAAWAFDDRFVVLGFGADGDIAPLGFGAIFVGYLLGALCAELSLVRRARGPRRAAILTPRELPDYLPRRQIVAQRALGAAAALGLLALGAVPYPADVSDPSPASLLAGALVLLAFAAGLEAIERWLVRRPQPFTDPALVATDDAIRAQSIRAVAGAGLALLLLTLCGVCLGLQASDVDALQSLMVVPAAACLVLSLLPARA